MTTQINRNLSLNTSNDASIARDILQCLFKNYSGSFLIRLWDDSMLKIGQGAAAFTLALKQTKVLRDLILYRLI